MHAAPCLLLAGTVCLVLAVACGGPSDNNLFATDANAGALPAQAPSNAAGGSVPTTTSDSQGATSAVQGGTDSAATVTAGAASGGVSSGGLAGVSSGGDSGALGAEGGALGEGGSGGDDAAAPPGSACHDHTTVAPALLADCEANLNGWFAFMDAAQIEVVAVHPGADNTNTAVEFRGAARGQLGHGVGPVLFRRVPLLGCVLLGQRARWGSHSISSCRSGHRRPTRPW